MKLKHKFTTFNNELIHNIESEILTRDHTNLSLWKWSIYHGNPEWNDERFEKWAMLFQDEVNASISVWWRGEIEFRRSTDDDAAIDFGSEACAGKFKFTFASIAEYFMLLFGIFFSCRTTRVIVGVVDDMTWSSQKESTSGFCNFCNIIEAWI